MLEWNLARLTVCYILTAPTEFTSVPFPVKAIKILLHEVQSGGEPATMGNAQEFADDVDSEDGVSKPYFINQSKPSLNTSCRTTTGPTRATSPRRVNSNFSPNSLDPRGWRSTTTIFWMTVMMKT